jgi:hypothetical protein
VGIPGTPETPGVSAGRGADAAAVEPGYTNSATSEQDVRVLTMASGKRIHVLHEFPTAPKPTPVTRAQRAVVLVARIVAIILFAALLLCVASVFATAQANNISYGTALDLIVNSIRLP